MPDAKKILIIDDDKDYGDALRIVLENNGYTVKHVLNIDDGRSSVLSEPPDLIILDVMMERHTDGFDLCSDLKNDRSCSMIPILMVTAVTEKTGFKFSPETDGEYCLADDYISKPVPVSDLLSRVNKLISGAGSC
ncbi:MAG TPA: response regulator [Deltaproteobacteria bacterium]|nr:response regulator [Deltaproteobacteria bacterium]